jgi:hypothetical protein
MVSSAVPHSRAMNIVPAEGFTCAVAASSGGYRLTAGVSAAIRSIPDMMIPKDMMVRRLAEWLVEAGGVLVPGGVSEQQGDGPVVQGSSEGLCQGARGAQAAMAPGPITGASARRSVRGKTPPRWSSREPSELACGNIVPITLLCGAVSADHLRYV